MRTRAQEERWRSRPVASLMVRMLAYVMPIVAAAAVGTIVGRLLPAPRGPAVVAWWIAILGSSTIAVYLFERAARRLLPLATLLKLSILFPGRAPSRRLFAGRNPAKMRRRLAAADGEDAAAAAGIMIGLVGALSAHDRRTRGHSERVAGFTDLIANQMGLSGRDRDLLRWTALLHDIGKLTVSGELLNKADRPTASEWDTLRRHPAEGMRIAAPLLEWLGPWGRAIRDHHERFDGTGYPSRIGGEDISIGGRIVAVADSYETMTAARPYKNALSAVAARQELVRNAGGQFDPAVVRAFLNVSLNRLRWTIGPLTWLTQLSFLRPMQNVLERMATGTGALATGALAVVGVAAAPDPAPPPPKPPAVVAVSSGTRSPLSAPTPTKSKAPRGPQKTKPTPKGSPVRGENRATHSPNPQPKKSPEPTADPSHTPTPTPEPSESPTTDPARPLRIFMNSPDAGDTTSAPLLPLRTDDPTRGWLPNYDTDRDGDPGLLLEQSGDGLSETDPKKFQHWALPGPLTLGGPATLRFWSAPKGFKVGTRGAVKAYLGDCAADGTGCFTFGFGFLDLASWTGTATWAEHTVGFGSVTRSIPAGRALVLRLMADSRSSESMWFAYDTVAYPSALTVTVT